MAFLGGMAIWFARRGPGGTQRVVVDEARLKELLLVQCETRPMGGGTWGQRSGAGAGPGGAELKQVASARELT